MNSAQKIIARFGGQSALAGALGKGQSTVAYWAKTGVIPVKWHAEILSLAKANSIDVDPSELAPSLPSKPDTSKELGLVPVAKHLGTLTISEGVDVPCYVLDDGRRIISRTGATNALTDGRGGGNLESYLSVEALRDYLPSDLDSLMVRFDIKEVVNKTVQGFEADTFLEICKAYVNARDNNAPLTERQKDIAKKAGAFLAACAKVGLIALIDEATGYQYERPVDALRFKLKLYLDEEMRKWEKTFPDELWKEFGRLTNWTGSVVQRPKYWGKLVMELVYDYLDADVAKWLKDNAPSPRHGQNYHQWLSAQYGLKKLVEHIWMLIGMAKGCITMPELREKMAAHFGREPFQFTFYLPPPGQRPLWTDDGGKRTRGNKQ